MEGKKKKSYEQYAELKKDESGGSHNPNAIREIKDKFETIIDARRETPLVEKL